MLPSLYKKQRKTHITVTSKKAHAYWNCFMTKFKIFSSITTDFHFLSQNCSQTKKQLPCNEKSPPIPSSIPELTRCCQHNSDCNLEVVTCTVHKTKSSKITPGWAFHKNKAKSLPLIYCKYKVRLLPPKQSRCKIFALLKLRGVPGLGILSCTTAVMKKAWRIIKET